MRYEKAERLSEAVKKVDVQRMIVEKKEHQAVKELARLSLDDRALISLSTSSQPPVSRRSLPLDLDEIRKLR